MSIQSSQIVFEDENLLIRAISGERPKAVVSFASLRERKQGFGEAYFMRTNTPAVFFISKMDNWYLTPSTKVGCAAARMYLDHLGFGTVLTYGTSMGAYGAAMCSTELQADSCLFLAPQWSANPIAPPYEKRWRGEARLIDFSNDNLAHQISPTARKWILADLLSADAKHALLLSDMPNSEVINLPFGGHSIPAFLQECGVLKAVFEQAYTGTLTSNSARALTKPNRAKSSVYWETMGRSAFSTETKYFKKGVGKRSIPFMQRAFQLAPQKEKLGLDIASIMIDAGQAADALLIFQLAADVDPTNVRAWRGISRCHSKMQNHNQAIEAARRALAIKPEVEDLRRVLARTLAEVGQYDAAITILTGKESGNSDTESAILLDAIIKKRDSQTGRSVF